MPRSALAAAGPSPASRRGTRPNSVKRIHRVLATGRGEPARRQPQRRHRVPVQLDDEDHAARTGRPTADVHRGASPSQSWCGATPSAVPARGGPRSRARLPGRARITTRSAGSSSSMTVARDMPQPTGHPVPLHRGADRFGDHQPILGPVLAVVDRTQCVHDEVGLHRPHPLTDRGTEFRRPRHPVPRRKHRARSCVESRSQ